MLGVCDDVLEFLERGMFVQFDLELLARNEPNNRSDQFVMARSLGERLQLSGDRSE